MIDKEYIKQLRQRLGLSQAKFAKLLGVQQATIGMIESGTRDVPKSVILALENMNLEDAGEDNQNKYLASIPFYNIGAAAGAGESDSEYPGQPGPDQRQRQNGAPRTGAGDGQRPADGGQAGRDHRAAGTLRYGAGKPRHGGGARRGAGVGRDADCL